jgi:hypothetical protein
MTPWLALGQSFPFRDQVDIIPSSEQGKVTIEAESMRMRRDEVYHIKYSYHAGNASYDVYNWQFHTLIPLPGQLVIYDKNQQYIGDLLGRGESSQRMVTSADWTFLSEETFLGKRLRFRAGLVPNTKFDSPNNLLPAGRYYIQLVFYRAFRSPKWVYLQDNKKPFVEMFDKSELCRSNIINVDLVD